MGGDAAARQGGRDQRALVQRAAPHVSVCLRGGRRGLRRCDSPLSRTRRRLLQTPLLERGRQMPLRRRRRRSGRRTGVPAEPDPRLFFFNDTATTEIYTLSLHDALPI